MAIQYFAKMKNGDTFISNMRFEQIEADRLVINLLSDSELQVVNKSPFKINSASFARENVMYLYSGET